MTLRETIQAKLDAAKAEVAKIEAEMQDIESKAATIFDADVEAIKAWFESVKAHLAL